MNTPGKKEEASTPAIVWEWIKANKSTLSWLARFTTAYIVPYVKPWLSKLSGYAISYVKSLIF